MVSALRCSEYVSKCAFTFMEISCHTAEVVKYIRNITKQNEIYEQKKHILTFQSSIVILIFIEILISFADDSIFIICLELL